jgi:nitric oxide reductase large subunit
MNDTTRSQRNDALLRRGIGIVLALLVIQFVSGMVLNLYAVLPQTHPGTNGSYAPSIPWAIVGGGGLALAIHVVNWICLTLGGIAVLVLAILRHRRGDIVGTSLGLVFLLLAASGGLTFLNRGGEAAESLIMALGFLAAFAAYAMTIAQTLDR